MLQDKSHTWEGREIKAAEAIKQLQFWHFLVSGADSQPQGSLTKSGASWGSGEATQPVLGATSGKWDRKDFNNIQVLKPVLYNQKLL